jgi:hypothetical protein
VSPPAGTNDAKFNEKLKIVSVHTSNTAGVSVTRLFVGSHTNPL